MSLFIDRSKRSAPELMADLSVCRQLRHLSENDRHRVIKDCYFIQAELWMGRKAIKHPNPKNPCTQCGKPRSKTSFGPGLCFKCYAVKGIEERDLWVEDVFEEAVGIFGFSCDSCGRVGKSRNAPEKRAIAIRMLENIEGQVKPVLCVYCTSDFKSFVSRNFGKGLWRTAPPRDFEKMALAWFAQKVKVMAEYPARLRDYRKPERQLT